METNAELRKSNAVLLYVLLNFPDGLKEGELYGIIRDAQKIHLEQYGSYIIGEPSLSKEDGCIRLVTDTIQKLKNKRDKKLLEDMRRKVYFEKDYILSDFSLYNDYLCESDILSLEAAIQNYWDFKPLDEDL